jgi:hypothetical protein
MISREFQYFVGACCMFLGATLMQAEEPAAAYKAGDVVFSDDFKSEKTFKERWSGAMNSCTLDEDGLKIVKARVGKETSGVIQINLPVARLRGATFKVEARVKGKDVSPDKPPAGTRFLWMMKVEGAMMYNTVDLPSGTFDWKEVALEVFVPDDSNVVEGGNFKMGLDRASGTWWVKNVKITVTDFARPQTAKVGKRYRGHNLSALRGVTLPTRYTEQDYKDLGKWNVNCGRWNIGDWDGGRFPGGLGSKDFDGLFEKEVANTDVIVSYAKK